MIPVNLGWESCAWATGVWHFLGWETRGGFHQVHHHLYKGWVKDKGGKLLFKKGEIYCGGKGRWTLAHRWMSTPSLVEIGSMHTKRTVDFYLKNSKFLTFVQGLLKNFLRHRLRKIIWPGNALGQSPKSFSKITLVLFIGGKQSLVESRVEIFF